MVQTTKTAKNPKTEAHTEMGSSRIPLQHLSIRVPWHDAGWDGTVCKLPRLNSSCLALNRIGASKNDTKEAPGAGRNFSGQATGRHSMKEKPNVHQAQSRFWSCARSPKGD